MHEMGNERVKLEPEWPAHPLLRVEEVQAPDGSLPERIEDAPDLKPYLLDGDRVVFVESTPNRHRFQGHPSALRALLRITGVTTTADIGANPPVASLPFPENTGVPELEKFSHIFGRDSLLVSLLLRDVYPELLRATVVRLAELQGVGFNPATGEEPGGILHDNLDPDTPLAHKFAELFGWEFPMYTTVDATPLFIMAVSHYVQNVDRTLLDQVVAGRDGTQRTMREALGASVDWLTRRLERNDEGLLEYYPVTALGMENHSWKDSMRAYIHRDGTFANHEAGIASVEVQGYAYDALLAVAEVYEALRDDNRAALLKAHAAKLRAYVLREFWVDDPDGGYFALATDRNADGKPRRLEVRASNMGYLLNSRILDGSEPEVAARRAAVVTALFQPDMLAAAGVRTLSSREKGFGPVSYHNGGVWPHDTGWIALGLERHGYYGLSWELFRRIHHVVEATHSFPEVVQGGNEQAPRLSNRWVLVWNPGINKSTLDPLERTPQEIQAWVVAAIYVAKCKWPLSAGFRRKLPAMPRAAVDAAALEVEAAVMTAISSASAV